MFDPVQDRKNDAYKRVLEIVKHFLKASGIIINSYKDLEPGAFKALMQNEEGMPPVYPVGPLFRTGSEFGTAGSDQCLPWLDEQASGSFLFVSFGSAGTLSHEQTIELAPGLEMSGQRLLWVFKANPDAAPQVQILGHGSTGEFLPHCGWNSALESITNGVPLKAWPLFGEQRLNAVQLTDDSK
ncbi:hypothetical protein Ancab_015528, partial [Ancistrocladus abbreviatus]